jgi:hypothetical protein
LEGTSINGWHTVNPSLAKGILMKEKKKFNWEATRGGKTDRDVTGRTEDLRLKGRDDNWQA